MFKLPHEILQDIALNAREARKKMKLSQEQLSVRSGVSLGSLKRFEGTGKISLESLLKLAMALDNLDAFDNLFKVERQAPRSIDDLLKSKS